MLWVNHAPSLCALGASRAEFYEEVGWELSKFIHRLRREAAQTPPTTLGTIPVRSASTRVSL